MPADPWELLREWLPSNENPERPLATVATIDSNGVPDARTQLLSEYDEHGFYIHEDSRSRKVAQLAANPGAAIVIRFPEEARQLVIQGFAEVAPDDEQRRAYANRSEYLQQLAWQNTIEFASLPLEDRIESWAAFKAAHADGIGQPPTWIGHLIRPIRLSFWFGSTETASRRVNYTRASVTDAEWTVKLLAG
ncbi:pyridoxamine 5'-phosphate oxidase family protein [uncultured Schumannella sp.]|uniref:pyridoxamine 5'-phosphate oxidase family protein n=1 Tax=uncultured Schumannella sp. TaxID=1195956 RepID=UPI002600AA73|nr:pyridoxamine 5'-phosphate oxidase family protein [uncultured Schumannella sp.]